MFQKEIKATKKNNKEKKIKIISERTSEQLITDKDSIELVG